MTVDDADAFYRLNSHPDVMRYTGEPPLASAAAAREAIEQYRDWEDPGYGRWACVLRGEGTMVGFCGLKRLPERGETDIGYRFHPDYWGRGLATEAARASLRYGFEVLGLETIVALVLPGNAASIRVLEKLAMVRADDVIYFGESVQRWVASSKPTATD